MKKLRCAVYTRKSSEEGLEQDFNSLDAQREACLSYIASQRGEGWTALSARYDDGGYSGGNIERPGLTKLLTDIAAGTIDIVVVYKVDRLTRSLADFARIVDQFDSKGVSFVSVTQAFNTTTSMGRLTLNVLLSFAQFEREVTGERIRDKIAASKAKGMWMGGSVPLGYEPEGRTLTVVAEEAETVQLIFQLYLELGSVHALEAELRSRGVRSKVRTSARGRTSGGALFSRGALFHLLQNRIYLGEIRHREKWWPGLHRPIIDAELFERVQANLAANRTERARERADSPAVLTGVLRNAAGEPLTPTHAKGRNGETYRYYVAAPLQQGRSSDDRLVRRLPATALETHIAEQLRSILREPGAGWTELRPCLRLVTVSAGGIDVQLNEKATRAAFPVAAGALESVGEVFTLRLAALISRRGGRAWLHAGSDRSSRKPDRALTKALRRAHRELAAAGVSLLSGKPSWEQLRGIDDPYLRKLSRLAFLSPSIQRAIIEGRHPPGLTLQELLSEMPLSWEEQHRRFCFAGA